MSKVTRLGAFREDEGVRFRAFSANADRIELCLFSDQGEETGRHDLDRRRLEELGS